MVLASGFLVLAVVVAVCVVAVRRLSRDVAAEEAERVLRSEYERFGQKQGEA